MSSDDGSQMEMLWDAAGAFVLDAYNTWGWIVPAILLTLLFGAVVALFCYLLEDLPFDEEVVRAPFGIFRWMRKHWRETHWINEKGTPDLACLSLKTKS